MSSSVAQVMKRVGDLADMFGGAVVQEGLLEAAESIKQAAIEEAPAKSGSLKAGMRSGALPKSGAYAASTAPHGHLIEFGTVERFHKSGKSVGLVKANPFFERAVNRAIKPAGDSFISKIKQDIRIPRG